MTRAERRAERTRLYLERKADEQFTVYNHALGYVTSRYVAQVRYTHRQRLAEHLRRVASKAAPCDTALLPWQ